MGGEIDSSTGEIDSSAVKIDSEATKINALARGLMWVWQITDIRASKIGSQSQKA